MPVILTVRQALIVHILMNLQMPPSCFSTHLYVFATGDTKEMKEERERSKTLIDECLSSFLMAVVLSHFVMNIQLLSRCVSVQCFFYVMSASTAVLSLHVVASHFAALA